MQIVIFYSHQALRVEMFFPKCSSEWVALMMPGCVYMIFTFSFSSFEVHILQRVTVHRTRQSKQQQTRRRALAQTHSHAHTREIMLIYISMLILDSNDPLQFRPYMPFFCLRAGSVQRHYVFGLLVHPSVCPVLVNAISQKCLQGISSNLLQTSTWTWG